MKSLRHALLLLLLACLLIWPAIQHGLVRTSWFDPAAFGAWGSHAAPEARPLLIIHLLDSGNRQRIRLNETPASVQKAGRAFLERRSAKGQLEQPLELAQAILLAYDAPTGIEIQVVEDRLNASTAYLERREDTYSYDRAGSF